MNERRLQQRRDDLIRALKEEFGVTLANLDYEIDDMADEFEALVAEFQGLDDDAIEERSLNLWDALEPLVVNAAVSTVRGEREARR